MNMSGGGKKMKLWSISQENQLKKLVLWKKKNEHKTWQTSSRNDFKEKQEKHKIQYQEGKEYTQSNRNIKNRVIIS